MMSESSSAVLDLKDADSDKTDTSAFISEEKDLNGDPLLMEPGYDIAVKIDAPIKQLSTLETYVTYRVRCVCARWPTPTHVRRRYNHFKLLHKRLSSSHPLVAVPPLPPLHSAKEQLDRYSASFVAVRTLGLDFFLDRVAKHPIFTKSEDFRLFVTTPDEEFDKVFRSENSALNLWGFGSGWYSSGGEPKHSNSPRVKDPEFSSATDYLQSLQAKLNSLCALTQKLNKLSTSLGSELIGMRKHCDAWSTQERGDLSTAVLACGRGAGASGQSWARPAQPRARATLPLLAAYGKAHCEKIRLRDALHASCASNSYSNEDQHNRLQDASDAIRSELADWTPKTRREIKSLLIELADRQLALHNQTLAGWESALVMTKETDVRQIFKTVSKNAVQNLSPSKAFGHPSYDADSDVGCRDDCDDSAECDGDRNDQENCYRNDDDSAEDDIDIKVDSACVENDRKGVANLDEFDSVVSKGTTMANNKDLNNVTANVSDASEININVEREENYVESSVESDDRTFENGDITTNDNSNSANVNSMLKKQNAVFSGDPLSVLDEIDS